MSLVDGTVAVDSEGNVTGSGFARDLYDALADIASVTIMEEIVGSMAPGSAGAASFAAGAQAVRERCAASANKLAAALNDQTKTATVLVTGVMSGASTAPGTLT